MTLYSQVIFSNRFRICFKTRKRHLPRHSQSADGNRHRFILGEVVAHVPGALPFAFGDGPVPGFLKYDAVFRIIGICAFDNPECICWLCAMLGFQQAFKHLHYNKHLTTTNKYLQRKRKKRMTETALRKNRLVVIL